MGADNFHWVWGVGVNGSKEFELLQGCHWQQVESSLPRAQHVPLCKQNPATRLTNFLTQWFTPMLENYSSYSPLSTEYGKRSELPAWTSKLWMEKWTPSWKSSLDSLKIPALEARGPGRQAHDYARQDAWRLRRREHPPTHQAPVD